MAKRNSHRPVSIILEGQAGHIVMSDGNWRVLQMSDGQLKWVYCEFRKEAVPA